MGSNELARDTAEKIAALFNTKPFDEKTFKIKDIIMDLFPVIPDEREEHAEGIGDVMDGLDRLLDDLGNIKIRLEE